MLIIGEIGSNPAHFDVYHLVTGFAGMMALSQNAAYRDLDSDALSTLDSASLVDEPQPTVGQGYPIQEGTNFNTTDEADYSQVPTSYPQMVTITSAQQNRLLSLLEQGLSILTPNNSNSASFTNAEFTPFSSSAWYSQKWKVSYEHEALCKLHTAYNYPGRFGTKGRCFYKLENYIADRCIPKVHYFWTRRREKELWLAMQYAKWDAALLQSNQCRNLYVFLMNMERRVLYLLMVCVTLASKLIDQKLSMIQTKVNLRQYCRSQQRTTMHLSMPPVFQPFAMGTASPVFQPMVQIMSLLN